MEVPKNGENSSVNDIRWVWGGCRGGRAHSRFGLSSLSSLSSWVLHR